MAEETDLRINFERAPTAVEKALWDSFVTEYCKDFHQTNAAVRVGFNLTFAIEYAKIFMAQPYVQRKIAEYKSAAAPEDEADEILRDKTRIVNTLRMAMESGDTKAAVTAAKVLAGIRGLDQAPDRSGEELRNLVDAFKEVAKVVPS